MALESATYVDGLVISNPTGSDNISQGDEHLRLIKTVLKNTFPNADSASESILAVSHNSRAGYTDVRNTSMADSGLSCAHTKVTASSTLYVFAQSEIKLWSSFAATNYQSAWVQLVYATSTTTGISPSTELDACYIKEAGMETSSTVQLGFNYSAFWKVTGLAAGAETFKVQGRCQDSGDGGAEFNDGTILIVEVSG